MKIPAAVLWERNSAWKIEEVDVGAPGPGQVIVELAASGICHSDDHGITGDVPLPLPLLGGHEGAGIVAEIGPGVSRVAAGDHIILSAIPTCGMCRWCNSGRANLCDEGRRAVSPGAYDSTPNRRIGDVSLSALCQLGTFASHVLVSELQAIKIDHELPLDVAALIGCGVTTGVQAATRVAAVQPGDVVVVQGVGGVGINTVQGARIAGAAVIVAVDPVARKREWAMEFGATHTAPDIIQARDLVAELTRGVMADKALLSIGVAHGADLEALVGIISKGGRVVLTSVFPHAERTATFNLLDFTMSTKELRGHVYGAANPFADFPRTIAMYRSGELKLDELITARYSLDQINAGFEDMHAGRNLRGLIDFS
jgi:NDMA-dependent alcohol dehydrogenase